MIALEHHVIGKDRGQAEGCARLLDERQSQRLDLDSRCRVDLESLQAAGNPERAELQWREDFVWHLPAGHEIAARDFRWMVCGGEGGFDDLLAICDFDLSSRLLGGV